MGAFLCVLIPVYWVKYGPQNFLWFSDIGLFLCAIALWRGSALAASMGTLAVLIADGVWNLDFFGRLFFGLGVTGIAEYMFEPQRPIYLRAISLFHLFLPPLLVWLVWRLGYDRRALKVQTILCWIVLIATYLLTDPTANINWVFGPGPQPQTRLPPLVYLGIMMIFFPLVIYLPTHLLMSRIFRRAPGHADIQTPPPQIP